MPRNNGVLGHYFSMFSDGKSDDMTRDSTIDITAGETIKFGAFFGSVPADWVGAVADTHVSYNRTTLGTLPTAASPRKAKIDSRTYMQNHGWHNG